MIGFYNKEGTFIYRKDFIKIQKSFTLKNLEKIQKKNMGMWGWQKLPDTIKHYKVGNDLVKVPVGIRGVWQDKFEDKYGDINTINHPELINPYGDDEDLELTQMQNNAVSKLLQQYIGLLWASTGTGKTRIISDIISKKKCKTLIVCCNLELMNQMRDDLEIFFGGIKCKTISGLKRKQKGAYEDIVIGNIDSLVKQEKQYLSQFDLVLFDEVDKYFSSETRRNFLFSLPAKYQYGLTGTIKVNHIEDKIFDIYFGKRTELLLKNFTPKIYKILTDFEYSRGELDDMKDFHELKNELYFDDNRNRLIIDTIISTIGQRKGIVFCEYIEHSKLLKDELESKGIKCFMLIGEIKKDDRARIKQELKDYKGGPCCLVGSVKIIGRGFNVSELSAGYLTTCEKFTSNIGQYTGRIIRKHNGKEDCIWYDFVDTSPRILANQAKSRTTTYYKEFPGCNISIT